MIDTCPICLQDFETCPHDYAQLTKHKEHNKLIKLIDSRIALALRNAGDSLEPR